MEFLLSLVFKFLPFIVAGIGILAAYFGVKRKGANEERARQEKKDAQALRQLESQISAARDKDSEIDRRTKNEIAKIKEKHKPPVDTGDKFTF